MTKQMTIFSEFSCVVSKKCISLQQKHLYGVPLHVGGRLRSYPLNLMQVMLTQGYFFMILYFVV